MTLDTEPTGPVRGAGQPARPHFLRAVLRRPSAVGSLAVLTLIVLGCAMASLVAPYSPLAQDYRAVNTPPSGAHPLGTDSLGRDVLSRLLYGGQVTLTGALVAVVVFTVIGVTVGLVSGSTGGRLDTVVMRVTELIQASPGLIILLVVLAIFGSNETAAMLTLGVLASPVLVRVVRAASAEARTELFVTAARVAGLTPGQVRRRHILPAVAGPALTQVMLFAATAILTEAGLGFLGLGVQPPQPNWGNMITDAQNVMTENPWMLVPTGGTLVVVCLALGLLGNAVRDAYSGRSTRDVGVELTWRSMRVPARSLPASSQPSAPEALLCVRDLSVTVDDGRTTLVDGVCFDVAPGEALGIVGESGCGKTTAVTALLRVTPPGSRISAGACLLEGQDLMGLDDREINRVRGRRIGYISQEPVSSLDPSFTAGRQLAEAVRHHRGVGRRDARRITLELLKQVRLPDPERVARSYPHELSGGMAQRVAIARALAGRPRLLIADEPTTALDVTVQAEILDLLRDIREETGMAMILVTHDWGVLSDACDRAVVMYAGQVVEEARVADLVASPRHPYSRALLESNPSESTVGERLPTIPGIVPDPDDWPVSCRFADRCAFAEADCRESAVATADSADRRVRCLHPVPVDLMRSRA
ncbi:dipeptide/oligopeptide/nickel ABC transporter permease/ATP-binding protein [Streptomyces sp. VNUA24]|uniref:dipeptide/oligopeptide/nickel ABC transporter permease/ATP-binding protein n=1 Tax=Streptomyces sp. VNUA24 TaxID=3031131 RepID=UPI0023B7F874|nr:dipeptide/oligopeptide/nickel ABC transporter permease/ATP-binding protein [Streptomyces sp. VNUA24]WEH12876.1 dipeptide/oligopeptide/nickel ABC transporter permease/ATP-binding protein [Streptomyces sp. VNUA24]